MEAKPFNDELATLVSLGKIYNDLDRSYANVKVLLVDACRNERARGVNGDTAPPPPRGVAAMFSCAAGEVAYEHEKFKHGVFFYYVLEGLRGEAVNKRGEVTFGTLQDYVCSNVGETVADLIGGGAKQSPNVKSDLQGASPVLFAASFSRGTSNSVGMKLVYIPPGKFQMGSTEQEKERRNDELQHEVEITKGFYLGKYEVTQEQYQTIMGNNPSFFKGSKLPVECVSWDDAKEFCRKLSLNTGQTFRLPSEAEWEYACRAGTNTPFHFGETITTDQVNYDGASPYPYGNRPKGVYRQKTTVVGSSGANSFGLHDMHGNVWEWCEDWYNEKYEKSPRRDPLNLQGGSFRVMRGGCWSSLARFCRSALRYGYAPSYRSLSLGFRVARSSVE